MAALDDLSMLLSELGLQEYQAKLTQNGIDYVDDLRGFTVDKLMSDVGMKKGHARRIMNAVAPNRQRSVAQLLEKDPLMLGFTPKEFRRVYDSISPDGPLCTPDSLIGEMAPTSRAGADALVAKMDASGDFKNQNPFFWPPAYRILKDKVRRRAEARACARARARVRGRAWARAWARERACVREQAHEAYESPTTQHAPDP